MQRESFMIWLIVLHGDIRWRCVNLCSKASNSQAYALGRNKILPRDAMLARYTLSSCVCLSVRLTHAGIVPKRLNLWSRKQRRTIA